MTYITDTAEALEAALRTAPDVRVYRDPGALVDPPGVVLPVRATFLVWIAAARDDRAIEELWKLIPVVSAAIATDGRFAVTRAEPAALAAGSTDLPAYTLTVETTLV
jgi:hypothetical protein